jgi:hypothetical protein
MKLEKREKKQRQANLGPFVGNLGENPSGHEDKYQQRAEHYIGCKPFGNA